MTNDTIHAPATPRGRGALAIVRLSGPRAHEAVGLLGGPVEADRRLRLRRLRDPADGRLLDEALVVCFPADASPTGEPAAELHVHGGTAVMTAVLAALSSLGLRLALPGEFARRALSAGRLGLTQVEGLADLIDAETEDQRRQAARLLVGELAETAWRWRDALIEARALLEATIDFADEDDIPASAAAAGRAALAPVCASLEAAVASAQGAALTREGLEVAIIGPPNAGKSSLFNRLAGRDMAMTSPVPGTTRDWLEVRCDLDGLLVTVIDTAGQRDAADPLEAEGVARAQRRAREADLRIVVRAFDAAETVEHQPGDLMVWNKADKAVGDGLAVSATTGEGVEALVAALTARLRRRVVGDGLLSRQRHRDAVATALAHVRAAQQAAPEIAAEELRLACRALEGLIGRVDAEAVLGEVFSRFCLGK